MKYAISILTFLLIAFLTLPALAQSDLESRTQTTVDLRNTVVIGTGSGLSDRIQEVTRNIDGSPFYHDDWVTGIALLPDNMKSKGVQMMYSTYQNRVYYKEGDGMLMLDNSRVEGFALNVDDNWVLFKNGYNSGISDTDRNTYFRVVHDGITKILVHHRTFTRQSQKPAIATGRTSQEFRHSEDYYLVKEDGTFQEVSLRERRFLRELQKPYRDSIKDFANENDLDFRNDRDLAKIMSRYDELIQKENEVN